MSTSSVSYTTKAAAVAGAPGILPPHLPVRAGERSIVEGAVTAVAPGTDAAFYNQVQVLNRDVSTAALRVWDRRRRKEATKKYVVRAVKSALVRELRKNEAGSKEVWTAGGTMAGGMGSADSMDAKEEGSPEEVAKLAEAAIAEGYRARLAAETQDDPSSGAAASPGSGPVPGDGLPGMRIFEALAATGLRSARYCREVPRVAECIANDLQPTAVEAAKRNLALNGVCPQRARAQRNDAIAAMFEARLPLERFDVVDLDPYGSPAPFLDTALQSVADGGLLCVTATDMIVLAGSMTSVAWAKYGRQPVKGGSSVHSEQALRLVLGTVHEVAARHRLCIQPLLSLQADFYLRCFIRVWRQPQGAIVGGAMQGMLLQCSDCPAWWVQPLGRAHFGGKGGKGKGKRSRKSRSKAQTTGGADEGVDGKEAQLGSGTAASAPAGKAADGTAVALGSSASSSADISSASQSAALPPSRPAPTPVTLGARPEWASEGTAGLADVERMPHKVTPARVSVVDSTVGRAGKRPRPDLEVAPATEPGVSALGPGGVCGVCEGPVSIGGPLWMGPLHDPAFVDEVRGELGALLGDGGKSGASDGEASSGVGAGASVDAKVEVGDDEYAGGYAVPASLFWLAPEEQSYGVGEPLRSWRCPVETVVNYHVSESVKRAQSAKPAQASSSSATDPTSASQVPYAAPIGRYQLPLPLGPGEQAVTGRRSGEAPDAGSNDIATVRTSRRRLLGLLGAIGSELLDAPFYTIPSAWSSATKVLQGMPRGELEAALHRLGYRTSPAHGSAHAVKTDAPAGAIAAVARAWALRHPNPKVQAELDAASAADAGSVGGLSLAARITRGLPGAMGRRADALRDAVYFGPLGDATGGVPSSSSSAARDARKERHAQGVKFLSNPYPAWGPKQRARGVGASETQTASGGEHRPQAAMEDGDAAAGRAGVEPASKRPRVDVGPSSYSVTC